MFLVGTHILWYNDGTVGFSVTSGVRYQFLPATGKQDVKANDYAPGSEFEANSIAVRGTADVTATKDWWKIGLAGADYMQLVWWSKLVDRSGITGNAPTDDLAIEAQGIPYAHPTDTSLQVPWPVETGGMALSSTFGDYRWGSFPLRSFSMHEDRSTDFYNNTQCYGLNPANELPLRGVLFPQHSRVTTYTAANDDVNGAWWWIGARTQLRATLTGTTSISTDVPRVSGLETVWLAMNHVTTFTGTDPAPAVKLKGLFVVKLFKQSGRQG